MPGRIQVELQQKKPVKQLEAEAYLNLVRTADLLEQQVLDLLRPYELTATQYNVLRILRGTGEAGLCCKDIGARLITREPDITRLLDRLEKRSLVTRGRLSDDRRFLAIRITDEGLRVLSELDRPIHHLHADTLGHVGRQRLLALIEILEEIRARLPSSVEST